MNDSTFGTISNERIIRLKDGQESMIRRASARSDARQPTLTNLFFQGSHISKVHGAVRFKNNQYQIIDYNSTFGTIVNNNYILPNIWFNLRDSDVVGFVMAKPSSSILKVRDNWIKANDLKNQIPLKEFNYPNIHLTFKVSMIDDSIKFIPYVYPRIHDLKKKIDIGNICVDGRQSIEILELDYPNRFTTVQNVQTSTTTTNSTEIANLDYQDSEDDENASKTNNSHIFDLDDNQYCHSFVNDNETSLSSNDKNLKCDHLRELVTISDCENGEVLTIDVDYNAKSCVHSQNDFTHDVCVGTDDEEHYENDEDGDSPTNEKNKAIDLITVLKMTISEVKDEILIQNSGEESININEIISEECICSSSDFSSDSNSSFNSDSDADSDSDANSDSDSDSNSDSKCYSDYDSESSCDVESKEDGNIDLLSNKDDRKEISSVFEFKYDQPTSIFNNGDEPGLPVRQIQPPSTSEEHGAILLKSSKRSFSEMDGNDEDASSNSKSNSKGDFKRAKNDQSRVKVIAKEVGKGLLYALITIAAIGAYGSTIASQYDV